MTYRIATLLMFFLLSACATGPTYLGHAVSKVPFKVDGGKTINLPVTSAGPLPAENENYKIEGAGFNASLKKESPSESKLTWAFSFVSKKASELDSVVIEQVTKSGGLKLLVKDNAPALKNKNWVGWSSSESMTKDLLPWLYSSSDSTFVFKFTIKANDGSSVVMYQPSIISRRHKSMYLQAISGK